MIAIVNSGNIQRCAPPVDTIDINRGTEGIIDKDRTAHAPMRSIVNVYRTEIRLIPFIDDKRCQVVSSPTSVITPKIRSVDILHEVKRIIITIQTRSVNPVGKRDPFPRCNDLDVLDPFRPTDRQLIIILAVGNMINSSPLDFHIIVEVDRIQQINIAARIDIIHHDKTIFIGPERNLDILPIIVLVIISPDFHAEIRVIAKITAIINGPIISDHVSARRGTCHEQGHQGCQCY